jgi:ABC-type Fe3+/spermidine/putrescine transport system ATPase subunit
MSRTGYLQIRDLTRVYPGGGGVRDVNLDLDDGQMLVLLGPSGCGKTTLLRVLAGLLSPDSGSVLLDGTELTSVPTHRRNISMVFQTWALFPTMSVAENVAFGLRMRKVPRHDRDRRVREALETVGLAELSHRRPRELSGGQQQRVALARAIVTEPRVLLLDEPLSSLDHRIRVQLRGQLKRLQRQLGLTGVYVTHDHTEALALGDKIAVMGEGNVVEVGTPVDVFSRPRHRYTAEFLSLANVIPVSPIDGRSVRTPFGNVVEVARSEEAIVALAVRPETIRMRDVEDEVAAGTTAKGRIIGVEFQPGGVLHNVQLLDGLEIQVVTPMGHGLPAGSEVNVTADWSQAVPLID